MTRHGAGHCVQHLTCASSMDECLELPSLENETKSVLECL